MILLSAAVSGLTACAPRRSAAASALRLSSARGVDPSGVRDSAAAVQRFVSAHAGRPITVDGRFRMDAPLLLPSRTRLTGRGAADGFRFTWSDPTRGGHYIGNDDPVHGNDDLWLADLTVQGAGTGLPAGAVAGAGGLSFRHGRGLHLSGLRVIDAPSIAIAYQGISQVRIVGNTVTGSGRDGISGWWYTTPMEDVVVADNRISRMGDDGIAINASAPENPNHVTRPSSIRIEGNHITGHQAAHPNLWGRGILVLGAEDVTIRGNRISTAAAAGVLISSDEQAASAGFSSRRISVVGNTIAASGRFGSLPEQPRSGIFCTSAEQVTIRSNRVTDSAEHGMLLSELSGATVDENTVADNGTICTRTVAHAGIVASQCQNLRLQRTTAQRNAANGLRLQGGADVALTDNRCTDNGRAGDSRTPPAAGIWVADVRDATLSGNVSAQGATAGGGRQSWGIIATALAAEPVAQRISNTSTGAAVGQIFDGRGRQAHVDLWHPEG